MSTTAAAVAIAAAFTLGPVLLLAYQQEQRRERRRKVRGEIRPGRRPPVRYHVVVFRNEPERSRDA
jgi:hypothetical protein